MPSTILLRSPDSLDDKRIRLSNSQFARPFDLGAWTRIRVCFRLGFTDYGASPSGTVEFFFGLCSGSVNLPGDATCQHFAGLSGTTAGTWTRAGTLPNLLYNVGAFFYRTKIGTTLTTAANSVTAAGFGAMSNIDGRRRSALFINYTRTSPSQMTLSPFHLLSSGAAADISYTEWLERAEIDVGGTYTGHGAGSAATINVNEGVNGVLDHVYAGWPRTNPQLEISDIAVVRFA